MVFGADEAGRGPVLGSMFIGAVYTSSLEALPSGVTDSKNLSHGRIQEFAMELQSTPSVRTTTIEITVGEIDAATSLTEITADAMATAISSVSPTEAAGYADAFHADSSVATDKFQGMLEERQVTAEHKADENYKIVSAASILAKNERELHVENLNNNVSQNIGSGYPSDSTTRAFLKQYFKQNKEFPEFTRLSWNTCENVRAEVELSD